ncbi:MAG: hypothetical protein WKF74_02500 [Pyrinomonadaceae bacterium]
MRLKFCLLAIMAACLLTGCIVEQNANSPSPNSNAPASASPAPTTTPASASPSPPQAKSKIESYIDAAGNELDLKVQEALTRIIDIPRRLLALRSYLRSGSEALTKWAWSEEEISKYKISPEYRAALAEVEKAKSKFAEMNPGYSLHVNTEVRSLDWQLKNWNETASVGAAGDALLASTTAELAKPIYNDIPEQSSLAEFKRFLQSYQTTQSPTVAVPGLSAHGQLRAFDFQVTQNGKLIASTTSSSVKDVWDAQGWTAKLSEAIAQSGAKLTGPLASPREPWHYSYTP